MVRRVPCLLLLAAALTLPAGAAPSESLWLNAVAAASRAKEWSPGEMRLAIEMADDKGTVLETWDNRYRLSLGADGAVRTEVVSALRNGRNETRKEREAQAKRDRSARTDGEPPMGGFGVDPFDPGLQGSVVIGPPAGNRQIDGRNCVAFAFSLAQPKNSVVEGTAWLDAASGLPVEFVSSLRPLPLGVHEMSTTVRYTGGFVSEVRVEGSGSLLFLKRRFVSVVTLGGWFRLPGG